MGAALQDTGGGSPSLWQRLRGIKPRASSVSDIEIPPTREHPVMPVKTTTHSTAEIPIPHLSFSDDVPDALFALYARLEAMEASDARTPHFTHGFRDESVRKAYSKVTPYIFGAPLREKFSKLDIPVAGISPQYI